MPLPDITIKTTSKAVMLHNLRRRWNIIARVNAHLLAKRLFRDGRLRESWCSITISSYPSTGRIDIRQFSLDVFLWGSGLEDLLLESMKAIAAEKGWEMVVHTVFPDKEAFWAGHGFEPDQSTGFDDWFWQPVMLDRALN